MKMVRERPLRHLANRIMNPRSASMYPESQRLFPHFVTTLSVNFTRGSAPFSADERLNHDGERGGNGRTDGGRSARLILLPHKNTQKGFTKCPNEIESRFVFGIVAGALKTVAEFAITARICATHSLTTPMVDTYRQTRGPGMLLSQETKSQAHE